LTAHGDEVRRTVARRTLVLGLQDFSRTDLERALAKNEMLQIHVVGLARIANDVPPPQMKHACFIALLAKQVNKESYNSALHRLIALKLVCVYSKCHLLG
jgi:hypothetical protein